MRHILCCDWGTSNFRLYLVEAVTERIIGQVRDTVGNAALFQAWQKNKDTPRVDFYRTYLQSQINKLAEGTQTNLKAVPVVLSGMASSSIGIVEVPYASLPFNLAKPRLEVQKIIRNKDFTNDLYVFGGVKSENDVMRGEEVQLAGLKDLIAPDDLCILPGTHSKHIFLEGYYAMSFNTYMTGEIFQLLVTQSILSNSVAATEEFDLTHFQKGVLDAKASNILNSLFTVRTNVLLQKMKPTDNYAYLSGLLIGTELKPLLSFTRPITVAGSEPLLSLYKLALEYLDLKNELLIIPDSRFKQAFVKAQIELIR